MGHVSLALSRVVLFCVDAIVSLKQWVVKIISNKNYLRAYVVFRLHLSSITWYIVAHEDKTTHQSSINPANSRALDQATRADAAQSWPRLA
jgi:hypothetical protein